jgi:murein DD-endopeptidase MepM/ murein hydrolase activator NlpD
VTYAARRSGYGLVVEIDHGYGYSTIYAHADRILVQRGQTVERGEVIAQVGSTGMATSPHLHYEVRVGGRPMNPLSYVITGAVP